MVRVVHPDDLVGLSDLFERPQDTQIASVAARSFVHSSKAVELEHARTLPRSCRFAAMVSSTATTAADYLAGLSEDKRTVISAVRDVVNAHLPAGYVEGI